MNSSGVKKIYFSVDVVPEGTESQGRTTIYFLVVVKDQKDAQPAIEAYLGSIGLQGRELHSHSTFPSGLRKAVERQKYVPVTVIDMVGGGYIQGM